jgi:hypothetical protein
VTQTTPHDHWHEHTVEFRQFALFSFGANKAKCQGRPRAAAAQQLHALLVVAEPIFHSQQQRRMQMVDA